MRQRRFPIGAELLPKGGAEFRVWAPTASTVRVEFVTPDGKPVADFALRTEEPGYHSGHFATAQPGMLYRYRLAHGAYPDPASRFQPLGVHGPSQLIDPTFDWTDGAWLGRRPREIVLYELHLGTFTSDGTWRAAAEQLPELADLGITMIEILPIAEFPGGFGWGYDGVDLFAPSHLYGPPTEVRHFVNRAHALGIAVILDVVYNHLGPDGCFLREFSPDYFTDRYRGEWGQPLNFDGPHSAPVREFFIANARYWIEEFHFDGLRLDATQQMHDASPTHVIAEIANAVHRSGQPRRTFVVAENERQIARLVRPRDAGGYGLDALWNDDFHHSAAVAATGRSEAYYSDYRGSAQEFVSACKHGFLYQGQWYRWQRQRRGAPALDCPPQRFVNYLENHDQVANSLAGRRLHQKTAPGTWRALTGLLLLVPNIPLLFQGQEFAASTPFLYFADHAPELAAKVAAGRRQFLFQFRSIAESDAATNLPAPEDPQTFRRCKLDFRQREQHREAYQLHRDLLELRRRDPVLAAPVELDGAVLSADAFVLRLFGAEGNDRLLLVNLGRDLFLSPAPEPLLAPLEDRGWEIAWSSESPRYGGGGTPALETKENWIIPGPAAHLLVPSLNRELPDAKIAEAN